METKESSDFLSRLALPLWNRQNKTEELKTASLIKRRVEALNKVLPLNKADLLSYSVSPHKSQPYLPQQPSTTIRLFRHNIDSSKDANAMLNSHKVVSSFVTATTGIHDHNSTTPSTLPSVQDFTTASPTITRVSRKTSSINYSRFILNEGKIQNRSNSSLRKVGSDVLMKSRGEKSVELRRPQQDDGTTGTLRISSLLSPLRSSTKFPDDLASPSRIGATSLVFLESTQKKSPKLVLPDLNHSIQSIATSTACSPQKKFIQISPLRLQSKLSVTPWQQMLSQSTDDPSKGPIFMEDDKLSKVEQRICSSKWMPDSPQPLGQKILTEMASPIKSRRDQELSSIALETEQKAITVYKANSFFHRVQKKLIEVPSLKLELSALLKSLPSKIYKKSIVQAQDQQKKSAKEIAHLIEVVLQRFSEKKLQKHQESLKNIDFNQQFFTDFITSLFQAALQSEELKTQRGFNYQMTYLKEQLRIIGVTPAKMKSIIEEIESILQDQQSTFSHFITAEKLFQGIKKSMREFVSWTLLDHFGGKEHDLKCLAKELYNSLLIDSVYGKVLEVFEIHSEENVFQILSFVFLRDSIDSKIYELVSQKSLEYYKITGIRLSYTDFFYVKYKIMQVFLKKNISLRVLYSVLEKYENLRFVFIEKPSSLQKFSVQQFILSYRKAVEAKNQTKNIPASVLEKMAKALLKRKSPISPLHKIPSVLANMFKSSKESIEIFENCLLEELGVVPRQEKDLVIDMKQGISHLMIAAAHKESFDQIAKKQSHQLEAMLERLLTFFEENNTFRHFSQLVDSLNLKIFTLNLITYLFDIIVEGQSCRTYTLDIKAQFQMFGCNFYAFQEFLIHTQALFKQCLTDNFFNGFIQSACLRLKGLDIFD